MIFHSFDLLGSTMDVARERIPELLQSDHICLAILGKEQIKGRGQHGRSWQQPEVGLYLTCILKLSSNYHHLPAFSLVTAYTVYQILKTKNILVELKWPNDIIAKQGGKLGGILLEQSDPSCVLVGIGLNFKLGSEEIAGSAAIFENYGVELCLQDMQREEFAMLLSQSLSDHWRQFQASGFSSYQEEIQGLVFKGSDSIKIKTPEEVITGSYVGLDENAYLLLKTKNSIKTIPSGTVLKY